MPIDKSKLIHMVLACIGRFIFVFHYMKYHLLLCVIITWVQFPVNAYFFTDIIPHRSFMSVAVNVTTSWTALLITVTSGCVERKERTRCISILIIRIYQINFSLYIKNIKMYITALKRFLSFQICCLFIGDIKSI